MHRTSFQEHPELYDVRYLYAIIFIDSVRIPP